MADGARNAALDAFQVAFERRNRATKVRMRLIARLERVTAYEARYQVALDAIAEEAVKQAKRRA